MLTTNKHYLNGKNLTKNIVCFLDRDGVLIEEVGYLSKPSEVKLIDGAATALKVLNDLNIKIIVITNQAGVAKGYFQETVISKIHKKIDELLAQHKLKIEKYYYCPHHPNGIIPKYSIKCECRKPNPGMILQAINDFSIDIEKSFFIGDKLSDIEAANHANIRAVLVKTGHGQEYINTAIEKSIIIKENILDAVLFFTKDKM